MRFLVANHEGDAGFCCCISTAAAKDPSIISEHLYCAIQPKTTYRISTFEALGGEQTLRCIARIRYLRNCSSCLQPSASAHLRGQVKNEPRDACTYTCVLTSGDRWGTDPGMHALTPTRRSSLWQPSASAHLRGQVKNRPERHALIPACCGSPLRPSASAHLPDA